jgi:DegV family protein with EDD domain
MSSVALVTDSSACVPTKLVEQHGITVVPIYVRFGEEFLREGVDITPEQFYNRLRTSPDMPATSQPSSGDFVETYRRLAEGGASAILSIHVSGKLSGTLSSALLARDIVSDVPIHVVDTLTVSMAHGFLVLAAARALAAGRPVEEVVLSLEAQREHARFLFVVDTLEFLRKGGRIGGAQAFLGSVLGLKPLLAVRDGLIEGVGRVRTKPKALGRLLELAVEEAAGRPVYAAAVHAAAPEGAAEIRQQMEARLDCRELHVAELSPVFGTHLGPGTVGIALCPVIED